MHTERRAKLNTSNTSSTATTRQRFDTETPLETANLKRQGKDRVNPRDQADDPRLIW
ncbi:MAG: hypothetical protein HC933_06080 [Pleurocapsa sp. SU_196_0]|nr:hypothetical protein [Pleurocapsa sp. SU_196_0]